MRPVLFPARHERRLSAKDAHLSPLDRFKRKISDKPFNNLRRRVPPPDTKP